MLEVRDLTARYGAVQAARGIDVTLERGEVAVLVGANGAGKTTLLRSIMGQHADCDGTVSIDGRVVGPRGAVAAARAGIAIVPQGRRLFTSLTVAEHLDLSASRACASAMTPAEVEEFFPSLGRRGSVRAVSLSGGEQQMLAIARAILLGPSFVLMDEPTEGLAPSIVENVVSLIAHLPTLGMGVLVAEQHDGVLTATAERTIRIERGSILHPAVEPGGQLIKEQT